MRIGFISTRLNGTDGVSLEVEKWAVVLRRLGHDVFYCAGEIFNNHFCVHVTWYKHIFMNDELLS